MAVNSIAYDLNDIHSATWQLLRTNLADAIFEANVVYDQLIKAGQVDTASGGKHIETRLMYAKNKTVGAYREWDPLVTGPTESVSGAIWNWRQFAGSVTFSGYEEAVNAGSEQIFDLMAHNVELLKMSFSDYIGDQIFQMDHEKDFAKDMLGLEQLIENAASGSQASLGGIDKTANPWWENQRMAIDVDNPSITGDDRPIYTAMTTMLNNTTRQLVSRDQMCMVTSQQVVERFEYENRDLLRFMQGDTGNADPGFTGIKFKGVNMYWDERIRHPTDETGATGSIYDTTGDAHHRVFFLAKPFIKFMIHKNRNFSMTPFMQVPERDAKVAYVFLQCNMCTTNNRHNGVLQIEGLS